jgi:SAM-dependent methyltransferase
MCHPSCLAYGARVLTPSTIAGRDVLEVGAYDVNGTLRPFVRSLHPRSYVGVDMSSGPGVDRVLDAVDLVRELGTESFDVVITTEMLEHVRDWHTVISNLKRVVRPGGHLLVTTRSAGFPRHDYPGDFWRYEVDDMRRIFGDMSVLSLESDPEAPGVFLFVQRPQRFVERTPRIALLSMVTGRRTTYLRDATYARYRCVERVKGAVAGARDAVRGLGRTARRPLQPVWVRLPVPVRTRVKRVLGRGEVRPRA